MNPNSLIDVVTAAAALGVSGRRVHQFISEGRLPALKVGNSYVIDRKDLAKVRDRKPGRPKGKGK